VPNHGTFRRRPEGEGLKGVLCYIALGSNLGDRAGYLDAAREKLAEREGIELLECSGVEKTDPLDITDQPEFLNQVCRLRTVLSPLRLMETCLEIEQSLGRIRRQPRGPRTIDLDILLYGDRIMDTENLVLPHPRMKEREFILRHLLELDGEIRDPVTGKLFREIYRNGFKEHTRLRET
jgi:2-amino-4-hydroxy-6-hydroxymethyldihydropteridine diphosphokinase